MDKKALQKYAENLWLEYCLIFPKLVKYDCPDIILNNRFTKTAGCSYQELNVVHIGAKFMPKHKSAMLSIILPHELAHQIDFNLFGASEKKCGHGKSWCKVMVKIGLPATRYHSLEI
jgi:predicted SprT family Zn-dependent metalloprotease